MPLLNYLEMNEFVGKGGKRDRRFEHLGKGARLKIGTEDLNI
jgi:hypothetical protein